jgi:hypothetical protein
MKKVLIVTVLFLAISAPATFATKADSTKSQNGTSGVAAIKTTDNSDLKLAISKLEERIMVLESKVAELEKSNKPRLAPANIK